MNIGTQLANKFDTVDDKLEFLTRRLDLHQSFLQHKFQREFEEFLCQRFDNSDSSDSDDEDALNVSFADSSNSAETNGFHRTSSTSQEDEQCEDIEEKFRPSESIEPSQPESSNAMRLRQNDDNDTFPSHFTSRMFEDSNWHSGGTSAAETPSSSSNAVRRLQEVEEDSQGNLPERQFEASDSSVSDDEDSPNFPVAADAGLLNCAETEETTNGLQRTTSTSQKDEQCEDIEEKFRPSELVEPAESESLSVMRPSKNDANKKVSSDLEISTSRRLQYSNLPCGSTSTAAVPSLSSNNPEQRTHPEDKCEDGEENLPKLRSPMKLRKRRRNETEQEPIPTTKGPRQTTLDGGCENLQETDEDGEASLASAGTSVDSSSSKDFESDQKKFNCSVCPSRFLTTRDLRRHQLIHANEKPHKCSSCEKSFRKAGTLRGHELIHKYEKPHECSFCEKSFRLLELCVTTNY